MTLTSWQRRLGAGSLPFLALTLSFASFDWMMSLDPRFFSTIFGVYWFAGSFMAAFAVTIIAGTLTRGDPRRFGHHMSAEHFHSLGKFLLAFVAFWAYVAFSQFMLIWIANVPEEVPWYILRIDGGWLWVGAFLAVLPLLRPVLPPPLPRPEARPAGALARRWLAAPRPLGGPLLAGHAAPPPGRPSPVALGPRGVRGDRGRAIAFDDLPDARGPTVRSRSLPRRLAEVPAAMTDRTPIRAHGAPHEAGHGHGARSEEDRIRRQSSASASRPSSCSSLASSRLDYLRLRQGEHPGPDSRRRSGKSKIAMVEQDVFDVDVRGPRDRARGSSGSARTAGST